MTGFLSKRRVWMGLSVGAAALLLILAQQRADDAPADVRKIAVPAQESAPRTFFWDGKALAESRRRLEAGNFSLKKKAALERVIQEGEAALLTENFSVTHKKERPEWLDAHDFCTLSPYFWPNKIFPGGRPYFFRDGLVNPESEGENYDRTRYLTLLRTVQKLGLAYFFTKEEKYAERLAELMRAWFLDEKTRMNPHFKHAQVIPGLTRGFSLGVIRGTELVRMLDALALTENSPAWTDADAAALKDWFRQYLKWVRQSGFGRREYRMKNNHGTWYDAHVAAVALFVGERETAEEILLRSARRRIEKQIAADGSQPHELKRSRSWYYSIYNLEGLFAIAAVAEKAGLDLWNFRGKEGESLRSALDYLIPYALGEKKWPHEQILKEEDWISDFVPLLCIAANKYNAPDYRKIIPQLPPLPPSDRARVLFDVSRRDTKEREAR